MMVANHEIEAFRESTRVMPKHPAAASLLVAAGLVFAAAQAAADEIADWPCEQPYLEKLTPQDLGDGLPAIPAEDWHADARVSKTVEAATDPEWPAPHGATEIAALAHDAGSDRARAMGLVLAGIVDETNSLRAFLVEGIRASVIKARVLEGSVADNDAALAALPAGGSDADAKKREDIRQARFWNMRSLDDAKDGATLLCKRLAYLDKKTRALADSVRTQAQGQ
jgi:hypothetical protein